MSRTFNRRTNVRATVRQRAAGQCEVCGIHVNARGKQTDMDFPTMHHRWPRREHGVDHVANLLYICRRCHSLVVHGDEELALLMGWMAHEDDYLSAPVLTHRGWMILAQDGTYESLPWWKVNEKTRTRDDRQIA